MYDLPNKSDNTSGDAGSLPAAQFNDFKNESENAITDTGQTLTAGTGDDTHQVGKAMAIYAARGDYFTATGTANAQTLTAVGLMQTPTSLVTGMRARFTPSASCTAASTLTYPSLGAKAMRSPTDTATTTGSYTSGVPVEVEFQASFNAAAGGWAIVNNGNAGGLVSPVGIADGGTGQTTAVAATDALTVTGANITSAATTDLAAATGINVTVTGSTTITALGSGAPTGAIRIVRFSAAPLITHNATTLICLGGADIQAAAGDLAIFRSEGSNNWRMVSYSVAATSPIRTSKTGYVTYTADNAVYTLAHTLGFMPDSYTIFMENINTDGDWDTGDTLKISSYARDGSTGNLDNGLSFYADATNIYIVVGLDGFSAIEKDTTHNKFTVSTGSDWKFFATGLRFS